MGADMELVRQFNAELSSIYEGKPPISKAKMAAITRYAVKALKYYKHVVHSVEKFIQKCHVEYKVPALYVLDSIIRQSRHQFGHEKDLFGPRFQKNIKLLFQYIYLCPAEDKPKIVRVLNLWQKNGIYTPDVISPLIDMASASQKSLQSAINKHKKAKAAAQKGGFDDDDGPADISGFDDPEERTSRHSHKKRKGISVSQDDEIKVLKAQLEQQKKQQELLQQQLQMQMMQTKQQSIQIQLQQQEQLRTKLQDQSGTSGVSVAEPVDPGTNIMSQIQDLQKQLERDKLDLASLAATNKDQEPPVQQHPTEKGHNVNENATQFLENFQQLIQNAKGMVAGNNSKDPRHQGVDELPREAYDYNDEQEARNSSFQASQSPEHHRSLHENFSNNNNEGGLHGGLQNPYHNHNAPNIPQPLLQKKPLLDWEEEKNNMAHHQDDDAMQIDNDDYEPPFHDVLQQHQLEQQREDPRVHNNQSKPPPSQEEFEEQKRQQKEIEKKQRDKQLLPSPRHRRVTVASVTIWVGRLPKNFNSEMLKNHFHEYSEVKHIDYIESRGCAFVTMASRFDADSALRFLRHKRIENNDVKLNWGKTKALFEYSQFWEENVGCAFIPWEMITEQKMSTFLDTCIIDEDTIPPGMSIITPPKDESKELGNGGDQSFQSGPPAFLPGFPPGIFPPTGMIPHIPPPGFRGQMPPIPPGIIPPNILQFNLNRPPGQNIPEGGNVSQEPRFDGHQDQPPLRFNNLQQPRPPLMPNQQPPFNMEDSQQPRPNFMRPAFQRDEPKLMQDQPSAFNREETRPNALMQQSQQPPFQREEHLNPRFPLHRPPLRQEIRLEEPQRPPFDARVVPGNLRFQIPTRFQLPSHQPQLEVRNQHGIPTIGFKQDERKDEENIDKAPEAPWETKSDAPAPNIPTTTFLLNLVNQQREKREEERKSERSERSRRDRSPDRDERDRRGRDRHDRRDRDRDRSDYRGKRDRSYERGRRSRDRDDRRSDRERDRSGERKANRDRSSERRSERDRSNEPRIERDRSSERRSERDRRDRYGRDRDEDRYRARDRSNERNRDKSREKSRDRSREKTKRDEESIQNDRLNKNESVAAENTVMEISDEQEVNKRSENHDEVESKIEEESNQDPQIEIENASSHPETEIAPPQVETSSAPSQDTDDLYDPMEAMNSPVQGDGEQVSQQQSGEESMQERDHSPQRQETEPEVEEPPNDKLEEEVAEEPSESPIFPIAKDDDDEENGVSDEKESETNPAKEIQDISKEEAGDNDVYTENS